MKYKTNKFMARVLPQTMVAAGLIASPVAFGAPMPLAQAPAGNDGKAPAPNLVLTLDDSGSMAWDVGSDVSTNDQSRIRMKILKDALNAAFNPAIVPDNSIRLAWNAFNRCTNIPDAGGGCGLNNDLRVLDATHRSNFLNWVNGGSLNSANCNTGLCADGGTPTHNAYYQALTMFDRPATSTSSAWAKQPGVKLGDVLSCRKSYVLLLTDGDYNGYPANNRYWTEGGSLRLDSVNRTLPDGKAYVANAAESRVYQDAYNTWGDNSQNWNSIADMAFHYWARDLAPTLPNDIWPRIRQIGPETITNGAGSMVMSEYWNPKNDVATWQHVTTYSIGLATAATWTGAPQFNNEGVVGNTWGGVDYKRLALGQDGVRWSNNSSTRGKRQELWHAAINSRGKFYPVNQPNQLVQAFQDILNDVVADNSQPRTSVVGSSRSSRVASLQFTSGYDAKQWSGDIKAITLNPGGVLGGNAWGAGSAASLLDAQLISTRKIKTSYQDTSDNLVEKDFKLLGDLSAAQQAALNGGGFGQQRIDYLLGDRTAETAVPNFRQRASRLGDIVNSDIWFMRGSPNNYTNASYLTWAATQSARQDTIYVGANDGMLHAFEANTGRELFGYVPQGAYANLANLTSSAYVHRYFVDGSPLTGDLQVGGVWKSYLAGFMGAGGKGYFILDVTDPSNPVTKLDRTASADPDVGYIFQKPVMERENPMISRQITQLNNGVWALVVGNGYNSTSEKAVLMIQYLDGSGTVIKIETDGVAGGGNGLSAPRLIDMNGDQIPDVAYAGDLHGNLWKFDISQTNAAAWGGASVGRAWKVYSAKDPSNVSQPITSAPVYVGHPDGGLVIGFGTGINVTSGDRVSTQVQSAYGIWDQGFTWNNSRKGGVVLAAPTPTVSGRTDLQVQVIPPEPAEIAPGVWETADNAIVDWSLKRGFYADFPVVGERVLDNPVWFDGDFIRFMSQVPAKGSDTTKETCDFKSTEPRRFDTVINGATGQRPPVPILSYTPNVVGGSKLGNRWTSGLGNTVQGGDTANIVGVRDLNLLPTFHIAPSWRQLQ